MIESEITMGEDGHPAIEEFYEYIDRGGWGSSSMNQHLASCSSCVMLLDLLLQVGPLEEASFGGSIYLGDDLPRA